METGKEFPPEVELDPVRAEEQAYEEKIERDLIAGLRKRMSKRLGIMDRPEVAESMKHVERVLGDLATLKSGELADIQDMRKKLNRGELDEELVRLHQRLDPLTE